LAGSNFRETESEPVMTENIAETDRGSGTELSQIASGCSHWLGRRLMASGKLA